MKSSFKLYFATLLFILTLTSFNFASDIQCPVVPPPPGNGGGRVSDVFNENIKFIKDFLSSLIKF